VPEAAEDRLHQQARGRLFPGAAGLTAELVASGALAACWSGAGPSLIAICDKDRAGPLREDGERLMREAGVEGRSLRLAPDMEGLTVEA
ncbi:MAG TPA: hypothetical protein VK988_08510, partial [Acidimicrobiales bacterium]|nr:hypothetical protein [Acidimicrobiales bacterium]